MNRGLLILALALVAAAATFFTWRHLATSPVRKTLHSVEAKLEWLRQEFQLSDPEYRRVEALRRIYDPKCEALCQRVMAANARTEAILATSDSVTPELESALRDAAALDAECRAAMLTHAFEVSRIMGGERGARYLRMMRSQAITPPLADRAEHLAVTTRPH